jgi:hypothetical protein
MKLFELYKETINEDSTWVKLERLLRDDNQLSEQLSSKLKNYLTEADKVIFKKFKIKQKDKKYFISGSARVYLYPELVKELNELDSNFPNDIGDLDVVIPDEKIWVNAGLEENLKQGGIYRPNKTNPPLTNLDIEAFTIWDPSKAGGAYKNVNVRSTEEIMSDLEFGYGHWFMGLADALDYKGQMSRDKEVAVARLIKKYENRGLPSEERSVFMKTLAAIITGQHGKIAE